MAGFRRGLSPARLRLILGLLLLALALPTGVLVWHTQRQLQWEAYYHYRNQADELARRLDEQLRRMVADQEAHGAADYRFLVVSGSAAAPGYLQRSPLADYPVRDGLPGLIGHFQVDADGRFSSPLLPEELDGAARWGLSPADLDQRRAVRARLLEVLAGNRLLPRRPPPPALAPATETAEQGRAAASPPQAAFDRLDEARPQQNTLGRLEELKLEQQFQQKQAQRTEREAPVRTAPRLSRREQSALAEAPEADAGAADAAAAAPRVRIFESEIDPFEFVRLDSGHFVLFRRVWRDGRRTIQGLLLDQREFLAGALAEPFRATGLARMSSLVVAWQGDVLEVIPGGAQRDYLISATELRGSALYQTRLSAPLTGLELLWTIERLPTGPGARLVGWTSLVLAAVLIGGFYLLYRLGLRQILLGRQQQDFIAAVSHELKTPLTSIRMYGEMLQQGWVGEARRGEYYAYIREESERLSRLIANVLQLARLERNDLQLELRSMTAGALVDLLHSRVDAQIRAAGFEPRYAVELEVVELGLRVDPDAFLQILINLVDNALKFSARSSRRDLDIRVARHADGVAFSVRDYGPGVPRGQLKKIFQLFYRAGDELTRETVGTGIGLALGRQLAAAQGGRLEAVNREPGAEFDLVLPLAPI